jgi:hypothetical protein
VIFWCTTAANLVHKNDSGGVSAFSPVQFSWHGFDDEHSFIDSYSIAYVVNDEQLSESESIQWCNISCQVQMSDLSNQSVLSCQHLEIELHHRLK